MRLGDCYEEGLLKKVTPSQDMAKSSLAQAEDILKKAGDNRKMGHHDIALVLCYTAMFHAARAILFRDGVKERSHVCIGIYLKATYPELRDLANTLDAYRTSRHTTLYGLDATISVEDADEAMRTADGFIKDVRGFLSL